MRVPPLPAPLSWHSYLIIWLLGLLSVVWLIPCSLLLLLLFYLDKTLWRFPKFCLGILLAILAHSVLAIQISPLDVPQKSAPTTQYSRNAKICGTVSSVHGLNDQRLRISLQDVIIVEGEHKSFPGNVAWTWENPSLRPRSGQQACIVRTPKPVHSFKNEGVADFSFWWRSQGFSWQIWSRAEQGNPVFQEQNTSILSNIREELFFSLVSTLQKMSGSFAPSQAQAMLLALLFGDRFYLSQHTVNLFADGALAHTLALSGQHLAVVALVGILCIICIACFRPEIFLRAPRCRWILVFSIPLALIYIWLGNAPASLIRAFCMLCLLTLFQFLPKQRTILDILAVALAGILVFWPAGLLDTGLQLSVACIFVIGLTMAIIRTMHLGQVFGNTLYGRFGKFFLEIFLLSFSLQIALYPLNLALFHNFGYWFPLNLLWIPMVSCIVLPCAFLGSFTLLLGLQNMAEALLACAVMPCGWIIEILSFLEQHGLLQQSPLLRPFWTAIPAMGCLIAALAMHLCNHSQQTHYLKLRLAVAGILLTLVGPLLHLWTIHSSDLELTMFDVGQGQALGIRFPGNVRFLIDGGGSYSKRFDIGKSIVLPAISYNNSPKLDAVFATHPDQDHIGGLFHIIKRTSPKLVIDNGEITSKELAREWQQICKSMENRHLGAGDVLAIGAPEDGLRLHVLHPPHNCSTGAPGSWHDNDASIVLRLTRHGQGLLLMPGDAGPAVLQHLLQSGQDITAQILVASHHGSDKNFVPAFVEAVKPTAILASCGFQNRFGFPGKIMRTWIKMRSIPFYHTDEHGAISVTWNRHGALTIRSAREGRLLRTSDTDL